MVFAEFLERIVSPDLRAIAIHWDKARGGNAMPSWHQLRPTQIAAQLSIVWAFQYDRAGNRFTGRLAGERIAGGFGRSFRGLKLEDLHPPEILPAMQRGLERVVNEPALYRLQGVLFRQKERQGTGERIMLPLADGGVQGDGVLGASVVRFPFADPSYGPVELANEGAEWFALSLLTAAA